MRVMRKVFRGSVGTLLVFLLCLPPGLVATPAAAVTMEELERQIQGLQKQLEELRQEQALQAEAQQVAAIEREEALIEQITPRFSVGGYASLEFEDFDEGRTGGGSRGIFDQQRFIVNVSSIVHDRVRFYSEIEFEGVSLISSPDEGQEDETARSGELEVEQAYMDFLIADWINVRAGALLMPFGRFNLLHDDNLRDLSDRPLVARRVIPTTWTDAGVGFFGEFTPTESSLVNYEVYVTNGLTQFLSSRGLRDARPSFRTDNNNNKTVVGRMGISPWPGQEVGVSGYFGKFDDQGDHALSGVAGDWTVRVGPLELIGEYAFFDVEDVAVFSTTFPRDLQGFYAQANLHFFPPFLKDTFLGRNFDSPTFTLVGRIGGADLDFPGTPGTFPGTIGAATGRDVDEERVTVGLNYRPVEAMVFKAEFQWNETNPGPGLTPLERGDAFGIITSMALGF
ncbi:hypothetical protein MYX64_00085 [Nitrospinae bacterium AH_259_B05_G02_I21]|nr:hypothetical protein [Nitrospinae bacterium AH_259_B05_G02_I21]